MMQTQPTPPHQQFNPYIGGASMDPPPRQPPGPPQGYAPGPPPNGPFNGAERGPAPMYSPRSYPNAQLQDLPRPSLNAPSPSNGPNQLPPFSDGPSNNNLASGSRSYRRPRPDTEEIKRVGRSHYVELLAFLRSHLAKVEQTGPRSNAREKLTRLSKQQFTELSTDVYDELMRRQNNAKTGNSTPFLAVRDEFHPKRNQARQKLATLPKNRFKDLASDVFFELERRFPELKQEFRPEAIARERQREADERQRAEMLQRKGSLGDPQPSTSDHVIPAKSTLVEEDIAVPYSSKANGAKSDVRDIDGVLSPNRDSIASSAANGLTDNRSTMYSQASSVGTGFFNGYAQSTATQSVASPNLGRASGFEAGTSALATEKMRSDYELRIAKLQQQVTSLESQNADMLPRARKADELSGRNQELERQLKEVQAELREIKDKHQDNLDKLKDEALQHKELHDTKHEEVSNLQRELEDLRLQHSTLQRRMDEDGAGGSRSEMDALRHEFEQREEVVQELKGEVSSLLEELRQLSARNDEMMADKDSDVAIIKDLHNQIASYKRMYESAKTELRNLKATSQLFVQPPKADDFMPASDRGAIADVNLTAFQSSIDELLAAARSKTPSNVLLSMKTVVLATTLVTDDVAKHEQVPNNLAELSPEDVEQLQALKSKCSATLNNLMTACRNHASSHGLSPVSLLDAAASHVSTTIVDFVKLLKVRKASKVETDDFEANFKQNGTGTLQNGLKPLHISAQHQALSREANLANGSLSPNTTNAFAFAGGLNPNSAVSDDRFSPRMRNSPTMGRYSPVGYKAETIRKDSAGESSWRSRAASVSSASSAAPTSAPARMPESMELSTEMLSKRDQYAPSSTDGLDAPVSRSETLDSLQSRASAGPGSSQIGEENWAELRNYIEVQTEAIVHSIQALLSAIREGAQGVQLNENLTQITTIVSSIVAISKGNLPAKSRSEGERILDELTDNCERLSEMQSHPTFDKNTKSAMASASYGVAKGLKALNGLLNDVDL